jgi:hypothetical protein
VILLWFYQCIFFSSAGWHFFYSNITILTAMQAQPGTFLLCHHAYAQTGATITFACKDFAFFAFLLNAISVEALGGDDTEGYPFEPVVGISSKPLALSIPRPRTPTCLIPSFFNFPLTPLSLHLLSSFDSPLSLCPLSPMPFDHPSLMLTACPSS